jgi:hypothetical protein
VPRNAGITGGHWDTNDAALVEQSLKDAETLRRRFAEHGALARPWQGLGFRATAKLKAEHLTLLVSCVNPLHSTLLAALVSNAGPASVQPGCALLCFIICAERAGNSKADEVHRSKAVSFLLIVAVGGTVVVAAISSSAPRPPACPPASERAARILPALRLSFSLARRRPAVET